MPTGKQFHETKEEYEERLKADVKAQLITGLPSDVTEYGIDESVEGDVLFIDFCRHGLNIQHSLDLGQSYGDTSIHLSQAEKDALKAEILETGKRPEWDQHDVEALWCEFKYDAKVKATIETWAEFDL